MSNVGSVLVEKNALPFISVVVPVYNNESTIKKCLDSIKTLNYPREKLEITVVNDGSTDNTLNLLKAYSVKIIEKEHTGYPSTINAGIKVSRGELIVNIDADLYVAPDWLIKVVEEFKDPKVGIASGYIATAPTSSFWAKLAGFEKEDLYDRIKFKHVDFITTACTAYRKRLFTEIGLFNELLKRGSDEELAHRAIKAGWNIVLRKDAQSYHNWASSPKKYFLKHVLNMMYEVDSVMQYPELLRGKDIAHPSSLYFPLVLTFLLFLTPLWFLINSVWISLLSLLGLILYHVPQTTRIIKKHRDFTMIFFPVAIIVRYVAWTVGIGIGLIRKVAS